MARGILCTRVPDSLVVGDSDLRLGLINGQDGGNSIFEFHVCGARTQFQTFFMSMASGHPDREQATAQVFSRWKKCQWPTQLSALLDTADVEISLESTADGTRYWEISSPCGLFGSHFEVCVPSMNAHLDRTRDTLNQREPGYFAVDTLIGCLNGKISACEVKINNALDEPLTEALRDAYHVSPEPGSIFIRHLLLRTPVSAPPETPRVRILRALWHCALGELTEDRLADSLRIHGFSDFEARAYAVLLPECFAYAWWRRHGLEQPIFWALDRANVGYTLDPEHIPQLRLALDLAEEVRLSRALLDPTRFNALVAISSVDDSCSKAYAENPDLTGGVMSIVLNAAMAEEFGLA